MSWGPTPVNVRMSSSLEPVELLDLNPRLFWEEEKELVR